MHKISILTGNHLCHNPRVLKDATTLSANGYEVEVLGAFTNIELKATDESLLNDVGFTFRPVVDLTEGREAFSRAKPRLGRLLHRIGKVENAWQLGAASTALRRAARKSAADLFIAHSESAIWALSKLSKPNQRLAVDMEDWFSEDLLPEARKDRPLKMLRRAEELVLHKPAYATCTSHAMSKALAKAYHCEPPKVIYNAFPWNDRDKIDGQIKDRRNRSLPSIYWYSQTIGPGRGLEDLIAALGFVEVEAELHLRGKITAGFSDWLATAIPLNWRSRVFVHDVVPNVELLSRIAEHDAGFAGEQNYCRSRDLTVTNKMLHYLLGGLAVVASDTAGQLEVANQAKGSVLVYRAGDPHNLAHQLNQLLSSIENLARMKEAALAAAKTTFCWEKQEPTLLHAVRVALNGR